MRQFTKLGVSFVEKKDLPFYSPSKLKPNDLKIFDNGLKPSQLSDSQKNFIMMKRKDIIDKEKRF